MHIDPIHMAYLISLGIGVPILQAPLSVPGLSAIQSREVSGCGCATWWGERAVECLLIRRCD